MLCLSMGVGSWGWQAPSCVSLCPRDAATPLSHSCIFRSDLTSPVGPVGAETGTVGPPGSSAPQTIHHILLMECCPNMEGPGCRDGVTASLRDLCSVTQELETSQGRIC